MQNDIIWALKWLIDPFRLTAIFLPTVVVFGSNLIRWERDVTLTSGADALLAIALFDLTTIVSSEEIQKVVNSDWTKANVVQIHVVFLLITAIAWYLLVVFVEPRLKGKSKKLKSKGAFFLAFTGLASAAVIFSFHLSAYRFRG